jgi:diketogulonate reductase-like aldo/keto reductase
MKVLSALPLVTPAAGNLPTKEIVPGFEMPKVSIGTFTAGSIGKKEDAKVIVGNWLAQGFRGVDTALNYFDQVDVAAAIEESGIPREEIFITTKIPGCAEAATSVNYDLKKLNTDYIDLLLIHMPAGTPGHCAKTWEVLEDYVAQGKLKSIGVSNFNVNQLQRIINVAAVPIAVNQIEYNVFHHNEEIIAFCDANNITVEAWSPLNGAHGGKSVFKDETVLAIAGKHNVSAAQVALRWIVQRGHVFTVLTSNPDHQANDADLWSFELADDEVDTLTQHQNKAVVV